MKSPSRFSPARTVQLAAGSLWLRLGSVLALSVFTVWRSDPGFWLLLIDFPGSAAVLALWIPLMTLYLRGQPVLTTDARRTLLTRLYPWLIAYEGALWLLSALSAVGGSYPEVNPVALAVQVTVTGASIAVSFLIYLFSLRQMANPADATGRTQLADLLNLSAALAAAAVVFNVIPLSGMPAPTLGDKVAYGLANAAEAASWLLLRWALLSVSQEGSPSDQASDT